MASGRAFEPDLLQFLRELRTHNNKAWFEKNRARYERVYKESLTTFVSDFAPRLARISPYLVADPRPSGGSVMRIFRDTRFSKDKSPYRPYTVVRFTHEDAKDGAGLFLYISPEEISAGGGMWHPAPVVAQKIRSAIVADPAGWRTATRGTAFRKRFELTGESLKRPPPGFPKDHPLVADLMRKDFVASTTLPQSTFTSANFPQRYEEVGHQVAPMLGLLCESVGLRF